jgi:hypothetical protein
MCSDCRLVAVCGRITDPARTGVDCPHFVQWVSRNAWMHEAREAINEEEDVPAWVEALEDAYANREMPWV